MDILLQVGVKALLKNSAGKFLLVKRSHKKYANIVGNWDIVGGRIIPGTLLCDNLAREIKEETNLELASEPKLIAAQDILRVEGKHTVRLTFTADVQGEMLLDLQENIEYLWLTMDEIKKLPDLDMYFKELLDKKTIF